MDQADIRQEWLAAARGAMETEAAAISRAAASSTGRWCAPSKPSLRILESAGLGHREIRARARKMVATLCKHGNRAVFLHPAEAVHGDLGIYTPGDPTILLSKAGARENCWRWCRAA
jgi:arabinose-5-phosphate isomerase